MAMFGLLVSGRLVDTGFRQMDPTHCVIDIPDATAINHIVVFLTGLQPFPEGTGGAVYFLWPTASGPEGPNWQYLGMICNNKPSAIFKITKLKEEQNIRQPSAFSWASSPLNDSPGRATAQVGISVEPYAALETLASSLQQQQQQLGQGWRPLTANGSALASVPAELSQKIVENLFNFASSFAISGDEVRLRSSETFIPFSIFNQWYTNYERRLLQNPNFWRS